jgi:hypothetical protein
VMEGVGIVVVLRSFLGRHRFWAAVASRVDVVGRLGRGGRPTRCSPGVDVGAGRQRLCGYQLGDGQMTEPVGLSEIVEHIDEVGSTQGS